MVFFSAVFARQNLRITAAMGRAQRQQEQQQRRLLAEVDQLRRALEEANSRLRERGAAEEPLLAVCAQGADETEVHGEETQPTDEAQEQVDAAMM